MQRLTVKTSTIMVSKGNRTHIYHSVREVPPTLRRELEESTNSFNSATILIADRRGKEEIMKALNGLPPSLRKRLTISLTPASDSGHLAPISRLATAGRFLRQHWLEICLPVAVGAVVWLAFQY
jgi:hypothetical protein